MLWIPQYGRLRYESNIGPNANGSPGAIVTTGASSSTKGTAVQLISSTSFETYWVRVMAGNYASSAVASSGMLDILIGSATESVLIPNLMMGYCGSAGSNKGQKVWDFNLYIPSGSRLSAQASGSRTNASMRVSIHLYGGNGYPPFRVGTKVTTYGVTTVPNGTTITLGQNGTTGSFSQITASTTENHFAFIPSLQPSGLTTLSNQMITTEIGIGAATEEVISPPYWCSTDPAETMDGFYNTMPTFCDVPSGTRLAMRASCSNPADGAFNGVIHALS